MLAFCAAIYYTSKPNIIVTTRTDTLEHFAKQSALRLQRHEISFGNVSSASLRASRNEAEDKTLCPSGVFTVGRVI